MSEDMPQRMSEKMSEDMLGTLSEKMSERVSDRMSGDMQRMSDRMSEEMPETMSERLCASANVPERVPEKMSGDMKRVSGRRASGLCVGKLRWLGWVFFVATVGVFFCDGSGLFCDGGRVFWLRQGRLFASVVVFFATVTGVYYINGGAQRSGASRRPILWATGVNTRWQQPSAAITFVEARSAPKDNEKTLHYVLN